jgi:Protein of unknown function (DUF2934)
MIIPQRWRACLSGPSTRRAEGEAVMGKSAAEHVARVRERAHAIWEREGRPEDGAERHWAQAEEELRTDEQGRGEMPVVEAAGTAVGTAGTETWTGEGGAVGGGGPEAGTAAAGKGRQRRR